MNITYYIFVKEFFRISSADVPVVLINMRYWQAASKLGAFKFGLETIRYHKAWPKGIGDLTT